MASSSGSGILNLESKGECNGSSLTLHVQLINARIDPFGEPLQKGGGPSGEGHVHIRIQQRNGRKTLTTVQGIAEDYDKKKIVKVCKKVCLQSHCWIYYPITPLPPLVE